MKWKDASETCVTTAERAPQSGRRFEGLSSPHLVRLLPALLLFSAFFPFSTFCRSFISFTAARWL